MPLIPELEKQSVTHMLLEHTSITKYSTSHYTTTFISCGDCTMPTAAACEPTALLYVAAYT